MEQPGLVHVFLLCLCDSTLFTCIKITGGLKPIQLNFMVEYFLIAMSKYLD
jgi:hypothetical protein